MNSDTKIITLIGVVTLLLVGVGVFLITKNAPPSTQTSTTPVNKELLIRANSIKSGNLNKKVTVVEFGDFQCPACASAHPVVQQILQQYKDSAVVVFRHFPLPQHSNALAGAYAAEAANSQGKFWEMEDLLYRRQSEWAESSNPKVSFLKYAEELKLNTDQFKTDFDSGKYKSKIDADTNDGIALGVNSTPTFYVNGKKTDTQNLLQTIKTESQK